MDKPNIFKPTTSTAGHDNTDTKSKKRSNDSKISKQAITVGKDALNRAAKKKRRSVKHGETTSKKHHEPVINNLIQQGWTVINHSRYQITVVKLPEDQPKLKPSTHKTTPIEKNCEKESEMTQNKVDAPVGGSHQKKTILQRLVKRSRKLIGRFFTAGKKED